MNSAQDASINIRVDPTNPGQFFACCGLLELADRLWNGAEGWFDEGYFLIKAEDTATSLSELLEAAHNIRISDNGLRSAQEDMDEKEDDPKVTVAPIEIVSPLTLRLDWWTDKALKTWAGSMDERKIFLAMCNAIDPCNSDPLNQRKVVFDPETETPGKRSKRSAITEKREPFYFDGRRGSNAWSIDVGFSPDSLDMTTVAHPVVEAMCFIGLQRCRPEPTESPRIFVYYSWDTPLSVMVVPAAVSGHIGGGKSYRFENAFRTDQKKHKAYNSATPLQRR